jgi:ABC-type transporter Mla subunit MlaD
MPSRRLIAAATLGFVGLAAILLVPRGGGGALSKPEYEEKVRAVYADVQEAFQKTNVTSTTLLARRVGEAQRELREAADELDDAKAPGDVKAENDQLVEGLREYADDLEELRQAAEADDAAGVQRFNQAIPENQAVQQIAEAAEEMKFEGYDLGPISEE